MLILIKQSSVGVFKRFLSSVLIRFIEEKACSHSAVLTGMSAPIITSLVNCGNMSRKERSVHRRLNSFRIVMDA